MVSLEVLGARGRLVAAFAGACTVRAGGRTATSAQDAELVVAAARALVAGAGLEGAGAGALPHRIRDDVQSKKSQTRRQPLAYNV